MEYRQHGTLGPDDGPAPFGSGYGPPEAAREAAFAPTQAFSIVDDADEAHAPAASARLRVVQGSVDADDVPLDRPILVIGRRVSSDLVIHDTNVSRQHARLVREPGGYAIEDTQSSNGTFVNDERVYGPRTLADGDVIRIGDAVLVYEAAPIRPSFADDGPFGSGAGPFGPGAVAPGGPVAADERLAHAAARAVEAPAHGVSVEPGSAPDDGAEGRDAGMGGRAPEAGAGPVDADHGGARVSAPPAGAPGVATDAGRGVGEAGAAPAGATRAALSDVAADLALLADHAARLAGRVQELEAALSAERAEPRRAPDDAVALVELRRLLRDLRAIGDPEAATAAANLMDQVSEHPRDVELLLTIARQAPTMAVVLRQQAYLMRLSPLIEEALGRVLD